MRLCKLLIVLSSVVVVGLLMIAPRSSADPLQSSASLDEQLMAELRENGFTGNIESTFEQKLGRKVNKKLAEVGRLLFFDPILSLAGDTSCASCHSPTAGFGDTLSISIGVNNNSMVGAGRRGPHNMRRAPSIINAALYRSLTWDSRFISYSHSAFDNTSGFAFPEPEGTLLSYLSHLLAAQAFMPITVRAEMAGFEFQGDNSAMRDEVARRVNRVKQYKKRFKKVFPEVKAGGAITYEMIARAIAEFEFTLVFANAPIDRYARGELTALTDDQKRGGLLFFGQARCGVCHTVAGESLEMFSNFLTLSAGVPQIVPLNKNVEFDGPGGDEDFGLERVTGNPEDRYKFRVAPLRNLAVQGAFFHNGAFTTLEDAVRHYADVFRSARNYDVSKANIEARVGPVEAMLQQVDPFLREPLGLTQEEARQLVDFIRNGLLDPRARPENLRSLIPDSVPSGKPVGTFE